MADNIVWRPFPLYVLEHEEDFFVLPTKRDLKTMEENIRQSEADLETYRAGGKSADRLKAQEEMVEYQKLALQRLIDSLEPLKKVAKLKEYEIIRPTFGSYIDAEDQSKDYLNDVPMLNDAKLSFNLMNGGIRLDGKILSANDIRGLEFVEANVLWAEFKTRLYPNQNRLPFLSLP
jgi:hypothetical protein